jgi:gliding motility-associated-like protein
MVGLIFFAESSQAQFNSRLGRFQVNQIRGCAPFTITINTTNLLTIGECTPGKPCLMDYQGNGTQQQNQFTFTYPTAGTFRLSVLYQSIGADDIMITVDPNIQPAFEIYTCSASQVSIRITDRNYDLYDLNYGDGSPIVQLPLSNPVSQHTYASAGNYNISVRGRKLNAAVNCNSRVQSFQAVASLPTTPIRSLTAIDANTLRLDFTPQTNIQYRLEIAINSTNFQQLQTLFGVNTTTIPGLRLDDNYYCFRLGAFDPCTGQNTYSQPVCTHNVDLTIASDVNRLDWLTSVAGVTRVEVLRDRGIYTSLPGASITFSDLNVDCNVTYCYQLRSIYSSGATSTSLEKCGRSFTTIKPSAILNTTSTVSANGVQLDWVQDPLFRAAEYVVLRSSNQGAFTPLSTSTTTRYMDETYATNSGLCYKINYLDECNNKSDDSNLICPIQLQGALDERNVITLNWSAYSGWNLGVRSYSVEKFDMNGLLIRTFNMGLATTLVDDQPDAANQVVSYRVVARANEVTITPSVSNQLSFTKEINLFYPTAFTPDKKGPSENEVFGVNGQFITRLELFVFDRWGSVVFYSDTKEPWDGTQSGLPMPVAAYVWTANITDLAGRSLKRTGTVVLLRK